MSYLPPFFLLTIAREVPVSKMTLAAVLNVTVLEPTVKPFSVDYQKATFWAVSQTIEPV